MMESLRHPKINFKHFIFIVSANTCPLGVKIASWFDWWLVVRMYAGFTSPEDTTKAHILVVADGRNILFTVSTTEVVWINLAYKGKDATLSKD